MSATYDKILDVAAFAQKMGVPATDIEAAIGPDIAAAHLRYRTLPQAERDAVILGVLDRIDSGALSVVGAARHGLWSDVWQECLDNFVKHSYDAEHLNPRFVGTSRYLRLNADYVEVESTRFEVDLYSIVRKWLFLRWLGGFQHVFEFGSGSAFNLVALARLYPDMNVHGLDWAQGAVDLVNLLREKHGLNLRGRRFDFFNPDMSLELPPKSAVMTFCALEQTGGNHKAFLEYLLAKRPGLCIHMEPIAEFYDPAHLPDALALRYHTRRQYLDGFLTNLRVMEAEKRLTILDARRLELGSLYHEGFSVVVWAPAA